MHDLTILDCLKTAETQLKDLENAKQCAIILMAHLLNQPKTWVIANDDHLLHPAISEVFLEHVADLAKGKPLPYITKKQSFYGLDFMVSPGVLIPRPETELMVDEALDWLRTRNVAGHAIDVGTGSGCIAISLLKNIPDLTLTALDISDQALKVALANAKRHDVSQRLTLIKSELLNQFEGQAQVICANLPYIPSETLKNLAVTDWEPSLALDGGQDGLVFIRRLLVQSQQVLEKPGLILLEIEATTGPLAVEVARESYPNADIQLRKDLAGKDRLIRIEVEA